MYFFLEKYSYNNSCFLKKDSMCESDLQDADLKQSLKKEQNHIEHLRMAASVICKYSK